MLSFTGCSSVGNNMQHNPDDLTPCIVRVEDINDLLERLNILPPEMRPDLVQERLLEAHNSERALCISLRVLRHHRTTQARHI